MVTGVSSATSCISAAAMLSLSMPSSTRICATESGWQIYGSPLAAALAAMGLFRQCLSALDHVEIIRAAAVGQFCFNTS